MSLVTRLTIGFLIVVICIISLHQYRQYDAARDDFEQDVDRTHLLVATTLSDGVEWVMQSEGLEAAMKTVEVTNLRHADELHIRWVCLEGHPDLPPAPLGCAALDTEGPVKASSQGRRFTLAPVNIGGKFEGAIEVTESPDLEGQWARQHFEQAVLLALMTIVGTTLAAFVLGVLLVGRPTRALMDKARDVGRGELEPDLRLPSNDELGAVAQEMNAMCHQLARARDETAREAAARLAAVESLRHADRLATVGRLASGLAHELGTPLNVVEARAGFILEDSAPDSPSRNSARVIIQCTEQMTQLIKQLLAFARPRTLEPILLALDGMSRSVVDLVQPLAAQRGVTLKTAELQPAPVRADEVLLQQALTNVVVNAMLASSEGGTVTVSTGTVQAKKPGTDEVKSWRTVAVRDDGVGMSPEVKASIFEPFFTTRPAGEGTGLGLPITLNILEDHGGFLLVDSAPGQGSTFTLHFPAAS